MGQTYVCVSDASHRFSRVLFSFFPWIGRQGKRIRPAAREFLSRNTRAWPAELCKSRHRNHRCRSITRPSDLKITGHLTPRVPRRFRDPPRETIDAVSRVLVAASESPCTHLRCPNAETRHRGSPMEPARYSRPFIFYVSAGAAVTFDFFFDDRSRPSKPVSRYLFPR